MKSTISFILAFVLAVMLGFYFTPENSKATSVSNIQDDNKCCIQGYHNPGTVVRIYLDGNLVSTCTANETGYFRCCGLPNTYISYTVTATYNDCVGTLHNITCGSHLISFRGVPFDCF